MRRKGMKRFRIMKIHEYVMFNSIVWPRKTPHFDLSIMQMTKPNPNIKIKL